MGLIGRRRPTRGLALLMLIACAPAAGASELVYRPINPGFGGNPFNAEYLLGAAGAIDATDGSNDDDRRIVGGQSVQDQFLRTLQATLLNSVARQVGDAIFGENAREEGTFRFDDQVVSFTRGLEAIQITLLDTTTGETTEISVPTLRVEN